MDFKSIGAFAAHLAETIGAAELAGHAGVKKGAELILDEARHEIGTYQEEVGPVPAWEPLSEATLEGFSAPGIGHVAGKIELGYAPPDNPLLRTGELRDSIEMLAVGNEAAVGSDSTIAVYQEMGTPDARYPIPPRSFLGGAAAREGEKAAVVIAERVVWALRGLPARND